MKYTAALLLLISMYFQVHAQSNQSNQPDKDEVIF